MARYTIREFTEAVGLGKDRDSVTRSGIILKALCGLGIAKEVGKKHGSNGRPAVLYEVQDPIVIPLDADNQTRQVVTEHSVEVQAEQEQEVEPETLVEQAPVPVQAVAAQSYRYDDDDDDD
jgi:hypothetical protein